MPSGNCSLLVNTQSLVNQLAPWTIGLAVAKTIGFCYRISKVCTHSNEFKLFAVRQLFFSLMACQGAQIFKLSGDRFEFYEKRRLALWLSGEQGALATTSLSGWKFVKVVSSKIREKGEHNGEDVASKFTREREAFALKMPQVQQNWKWNSLSLLQPRERFSTDAAVAGFQVRKEQGVEEGSTFAKSRDRSPDMSEIIFWVQQDYAVQRVRPKLYRKWEVSLQAHRVILFRILGRRFLLSAFATPLSLQRDYLPLLRSCVS